MGHSVCYGPLYVLWASGCVRQSTKCGGMNAGLEEVGMDGSA